MPPDTRVPVAVLAALGLNLEACVQSCLKMAACLSVVDTGPCLSPEPPDTGDSADTGDTADTSDTADTADTGDTGVGPCLDVPAETGDTSDTSDTADTSDTSGRRDAPRPPRAAAGARRVLEAVLARGVLPQDVAARLRKE